MNHHHQRLSLSDRDGEAMMTRVTEGMTVVVMVVVVIVGRRLDITTDTYYM